jgi:uncharacterized damage-inducible protein DinB
MDTQPAGGQRIIDAIWSVGVMLDYTHRIAGSITPEILDWRPQSPKGDFFFSIGEQVKHITDTRVYVADMLSGRPANYQRWAGDYPGRDEPWQFRDGSYDEIMERLEFSRGLLQPWIEQDFSAMLLPTEGTRQSYEQQLAGLREKGEDTAMLEAKGPGTLASAILFLVSHENGHRAVLQTMLRLAGADVERLA